MIRLSLSAWERRSSKPPWLKRPLRMLTGWSNASCGFPDYSLWTFKYILYIIFYSGIPEKGNKAEIILTVLHRNFLGVDEFLGRVSLPLSGFDHQEKPRSKCVTLMFPNVLIHLSLCLDGILCCVSLARTSLTTGGILKWRLNSRSMPGES